MSSEQSQHLPLQPQLYRLTQVLTGIAMLVILLAVPFQIFLAASLPNAPLFYLTGVLSLLLILPLMLYTLVTPPVTLTDTGLTLHPAIWPHQSIRWEQVEAIKRYPLLPPTDTETVRRAAVGRRHYQAADGLMLVVADLPFPYRAAGFFTGEGLKPVVAFTNRTHTDYERLAQTLLHHLSDRYVPERSAPESISQPKD